ncbi:cupin domain-containing protein [Peribacillus frigoritolerans]|uniref:cupin domain-containing protein n=1 Tax=Peribacillus frigoritolerans TaxID=450367 RepID=UPI00203C0CFA|nr:cupin domain-containing protein [Peribacillus frigoritolerans]MCM3170125.1 cupin domain-containing protein [Peribacillus frigoritolerans]
MNSNEVQAYWFEDDGIIPNNPTLPILLYPGALTEQAELTEEIFNKNNWRNSWINGVFDFHHYHSNAHEVLGVLQGNAIVQLGGEKGKSVEIKTGDVLILPAGTGHKRLASSNDFKIVGAYPEGKEYNLKTENAEDRLQSLEDIPKVTLPETDPVFGDHGPLLSEWNVSS